MEPKKRIVIADEEMVKGLPEEVQKSVEKLMQDLSEGKVVGEKMDLIEPDVLMKCGKCGSEKVSWMLDKSDKEVYFNCLGCGDSFWMNEEDYKKIVKDNPDCMIESKDLNT